jgi:hypothetical protein
MGEDGVCMNISEPLDDRFFVQQFDAVVRFRIPDAAVPSTKLVDGAGDEGIEVLLEVGDVAVRVGDDKMIMIAQRGESVQLHVVESACQREDVLEDLSDGGIGAQEEALLGAASRHEVRGTREDSAWAGHTLVSAAVERSCRFFAALDASDPGYKFSQPKS